MSDRPELVCPATQEPCEWVRTCKINQALSERMGNSVLQGLVEELEAIIPPTLLAADKSTFCSELQLREVRKAKIEALQQPDIPPQEADRVREWAAAIRKDIKETRELRGSY
jgi:hypothetical protein